MRLLNCVIRILSRRAYSMKMKQCEDNRLETFRQVCDNVGAESSYLKKAEVLSKFFQKGVSGKGFEGDTLLWIQMLIPDATQRVYNLQNKQMLKLFSRLFSCDQQQMQLDLEKEGDVSETLFKFFETSKHLPPQYNSTLYLQDVDEFLKDLEQRTKEVEQTELLRKLCKQATALDLKIIIRLIKQDLRINAGARHILDAFGPFAYTAYQASRDLNTVVQQFAHKNVKVEKLKSDVQKGSGLQIMTPISPMLANACKSVEDAFKKSRGGLYSEIKYDGERVQIHKQNIEFKFFSRNLKPVMDHKVQRFKETIPKAFPYANTIILDSEIILVDTITGDLLPFGTLGAHKKKEHEKAEICLFVFDCLLLNGKDLTALPFSERRKILEENIKPLKSYVELSESKFLKNPQELALMTAKVLKANLEGVVLKDPKGTYEPGKRRWLKVKKDYLFDGKMADTADLVVLGGWYGSGKKGGILSIFLMGCFDKKDKLWKTVTKVHSGLDDATNETIHEQLMKNMKRSDSNRTPTWLHCKKPLIPDCLAQDPMLMPVWEITGAEFTKSEAHTANGISIRFPRITKIRDDKTVDQADDLERLQHIYESSKSNVKVELLIEKANNYENDEEFTSIKNKISSKTTPKKDNKILATPKKENKKLNTPKRKSSDLGEELKKTPKKLKTSENGPKLKQATLFADKAKLKEKQTTLNLFRKQSDCFANLSGYFNEDIKDVEINRKSFENNGGTFIADAKKADLIFYNENQLMLDLNDCREKHKKTAKHLNIKWLKDSLEAKKCQPFPIYAMIIKQT